MVSKVTKDTITIISADEYDKQEAESHDLTKSDFGINEKWWNNEQ